MKNNLSINLTPDDYSTIDEIGARNPLASRHSIARAALRAGLSQMARDQSYAIEQLTEQAKQRRAAKAAA